MTSNDPFDRGIQSGKSKIFEDQRIENDRIKRSKNAAQKFYELLRPKFEPNGYYIQIHWDTSLRISPFSPGSSFDGLEIKGSHWGKGYSVRCSTRALGHVYEDDCTEERVLEVAGVFFGETIDKKKEHQRGMDQAKAIQSKKRNIKISLFIAAIIFLYILGSGGRLPV